MQYLVKWEGYDEYRNTWEPEENFQSSDILKNWREKKMRITRGLDKPFDVKAWEKRVHQIMEEIAARKRRRRLKKRSLGILLESSSSSSDVDTSDSDAPLMPLTPKRGSLVTMTVDFRKDETGPSRQQSLQLKVWTDQERRALEAGVVKVGGPHWNDILALYGSNGTVNQDLSRMNGHDLKKMVYEMRNEFLDVGQDPPSWLAEMTSRKLEGQQSAEKTTRSSKSSSNEKDSGGLGLRSGSKEKSRSTSGSTSRRTSPTKAGSSYMGAARHDNTKSTRSSTSLDPSGFNFSSLFEQTSAKAGGPADPLEQQGASKRYEGTARQRPEPPNRTSTTGKTLRQVGARGAGPARLKPPEAKPLHRLRKSRQKAREGPTESIDCNESPKLFKNLATQNRISKRRRNEPAPNPDSLALIDPRTGKTPKTLPPSPMMMSDDATVTRESFYNKQPVRPQENAHDSGSMVPARPIDVTNVIPNPPSTVASTTQMEQVSTKTLHSITFMRESTHSSKIDLFRRRVDSCHVNGHLKVGAQNSKLYNVRLQGLDRTLQQLLLTVKSSRLDVHFELKKTCLAAEYQKFFPLVCGCSIRNRDLTDMTRRIVILSAGVM